VFVKSISETASTVQAKGKEQPLQQAHPGWVDGNKLLPRTSLPGSAKHMPNGKVRNEGRSTNLKLPSQGQHNQ